MSLIELDEVGGSYLLIVPRGSIPSIFPEGEEQAYIDAYSFTVNKNFESGSSSDVTLYDVITKKLMQGNTNQSD